MGLGFGFRASVLRGTSRLDCAFMAGVLDPCKPHCFLVAFDRALHMYSEISTASNLNPSTGI